MQTKQNKRQVLLKDQHNAGGLPASQGTLERHTQQHPHLWCVNRVPHIMQVCMRSDRL